MTSDIQALKDWFAQLPRDRQENVLKFLYGKSLKTVNLLEGYYCGPSPALFNTLEKGLYCGPAPSPSSVSVCPTCHQPI